MPNRVFLNTDGVLEQIYDGDQSNETITTFIKQTLRMIEQLQEDGRPVLILVNCSKLGKLSTPSRKVAVEALRNIHYDKIAVYGANAFSKALTNLIIHASGQFRKVHAFDDRSGAEEWLKS